MRGSAVIDGTTATLIRGSHGDIILPVHFDGGASVLVNLRAPATARSRHTWATRSSRDSRRTAISSTRSASTSRRSALHAVNTRCACAQVAPEPWAKKTRPWHSTG